jgi:hypothetical protein
MLATPASSLSGKMEESREHDPQSHEDPEV